VSTLGQKPATQHVSTEKQSITGNGGTSYTLQQSVSQASDIEVFVNNTRQEPTVAYTANNTTLTMTGAVNASDNFYVIFQGKAIQTAGLPVDAAITASTVTTSQTITSTGNITTSGTVNTPSINGGQIGGRRNIIINGAMQVAQRGTSETGKGADAGYFTVDRMYYFENGTTDVRFTQSQSTDVPTGEGFGKSLKFDCTTADASLASDNQLTLKYRIEGQDIQQLKWGTSSAEKITLSFYIKSTKTGTFIVELSRESRKISQAYTVSSSDTWEKKTLTFDGDTGGSVVTNDSSNRLEINYYMGVGTNYSSGTLDTAWTGGTNANRAVGQVNAFDNTSNNILFTGIQLEVGEQATPFEHRSFGEELRLCQRYYYRRTYPSAYLNYAIAYGTTDIQGKAFHPVQMRASPTLSFDGVLKASQGNAEINSSSGFSFTSDSTNDSLGFYTSGGAFTGLTQYRGYMISQDNNDYMEVKSEL